MSIEVASVTGRQVLDSRGNPTVEVDVVLADGATGSAIVPSGASIGSHEAVELRDGGEAWGGKGVGKAVGAVNGELGGLVTSRPFNSLADLDHEMVQDDGTPNKGRHGANAILGISLAVARARAASRGEALWELIAELFGTSKPTMPVPMLNVINGGEHANNALDVQEFMIVPHGFGSFSEGLEAAVRTYHVLRGRLDRDGMSTAVGDEGGFAPNLASTEHALGTLVAAIEEAGFEPGRQIAIAMDVAATELYDGTVYSLPGESAAYDFDSMVDWYVGLVDRFPIVSIEDAMSEDDWNGWHDLTNRLGDRVQLVGDDLFVTNPERLAEGVRRHVANSILIKLNQIGTLSETLAAMRDAASHRYTSVVSHRSGETEDTTIADLAVGTACGQIKTGAPCRTDRVAKYNQLLRIEAALGGNATYATPFSSALGARA